MRPRRYSSHVLCLLAALTLLSGQACPPDANDVLPAPDPVPGPEGPPGPPGADATVTAGDGITVQDGEVSLDTDFTDSVYWKLGGNAGTTAGAHFLGTTDAAPLELFVNGECAMRLEPTDTCPNVIGGFFGNVVGDSVVAATIAGGGPLFGPTTGNRVLGDYGTIGGGGGNTVGRDDTEASDQPYGTISGGQGNQANGASASIGGGARNAAESEFSTIGGGVENLAFATAATIGGGANNSALGASSTIAGGEHNLADADWATIGGGGPSVPNEPSTCNRVTDAYGTIGGGANNQAGNDTLNAPTLDAFFATVGGGEGNEAGARHASIAGGHDNTILGDAAAISGGQLNTADGFASTISGGRINEIAALGAFGAIGGGALNKVSAAWATVPGGFQSEANGQCSFAAGRRAKADHNGAFVWGDSSFEDVSSSAANTFTVRASGGTLFYTSADLTTGVELPAGSGAWSNLSDRNAKEHFRTVDGGEILSRVAELPIETWNYRAQERAVRHMGPTAQDFHAAFGLGGDPRRISSVDADGVALAAIKELHRVVREQQARIEKLESRCRCQPCRK